MINPMAFKLKFAPHFGMFKHSAGDDPVDQIKFAADEGFTAWEEWYEGLNSISDQERISKAMAQVGCRWASSCRARRSPGFHRSYRQA